MNWNRFATHLLIGLVGLAVVLPTAAQTVANDRAGSYYAGQNFTLLNSGQKITPLAPIGAQFQTLNPNFSDFPGYVAGQAVTSVVSPDGKTLFVLTSGYNLVNYPPSSSNAGQSNPAESTEFVFIYDLTVAASPKQKQVIQLNNTYNGIAVDPSGTAFYVSGGVDDDVHIFVLNPQTGLWAQPTGSPISLGHLGATNPYLNTPNPFYSPADGLVGGVGLDVLPEAAGVAISPDGSELVVANYYDDSISVLSKSGASWKLTAELDLRPGKAASNPKPGVAGGEYPFWVVIKGNASAGYTVYVSSLRDREVDVVTGLPSGAPVVSARISVPGQPNKMTFDGQRYLYVAQDNTDSVGIIDTSTNALVENIAVTAPTGWLPRSVAHLKGNDTNSVTLTPDGTQLYVTNGWMNDIAVVQVTGPAPHRVVGLIPTGWYPNSVTFNKDGSHVYVLNGKSPTGPNNPDLSNPFECGTNCYDLQLIKAGLQSFPVPTLGELQALTRQVADNNSFGGHESLTDASTMAYLHQKIQHIIYIIKENRTYDQILGDLAVGNGDPSLAEWGEAVTPNQHKLASQFGDLDNFYDTSEVSMDGWPWSTSAHATDAVEKQTPVNYAARCPFPFPVLCSSALPAPLSYDSEGSNRNVNVGPGSFANRVSDLPLLDYPPYNDPDLLPGTNNAAGPDGPNGQPGAGFLWDAALRAGLKVRDYGFFIDEVRYQLAGFGPPISDFQIPVLRYPYAPSTYDQTYPQTQVAYSTSPSLQSYNPVMQGSTDPYFRGFDQNMADYYLYQEWSRDVDANGLANLVLLRLAHDHTGSFSTAIDGVNTPELQTADNDYAVGLVAQKIASSPLYKENTLIFVIEDDSQDGADHVDTHRSIAFVVGPYVKQKAVVSTHYTTLSMYRTMEDILGTAHSNLNDALASPMTDVFDLRQTNWTFTAAPSTYLYTTDLIGLPPLQTGLRIPHPTHDADYWAKVTAGMDFTQEDHINFDLYNHILWEGLMGSKPYPSSPTGQDLRADRRDLLRHYYADSDKTFRLDPVKQHVKPEPANNTKSGT